MAAVPHMTCSPCLLLLLQLLDGPYIAFVASVKLEGAYLAISQRDVEAEAEQARLRKLQEEQEWEDEEEEGSEQEGTEKTDESLTCTVQQEQQQGLGKKLSQVEKGEAARQG